MITTFLAAALAAAAPAAPADPHAQHGQHGQHQQGHDQHKGMGCCEHQQSGQKIDCCKDMADASKAKDCCAKHAKGEAADQQK